MRYEHTCAKGFCAILMTVALGACGGGGSSSGGNADDPGGSDGSGNDGNGGGASSYTVGGTISGAQSMITLSLNGTQESFSGSNFTFSQSLDDGTPYAVTFVSAQSGQNCIIEHAGGAANFDITNVEVLCSTLASEVRFNDGIMRGHLTAGDFNGDTNPDIAVMLNTTPEHSSGGNNEIMRIMWGNGAGGFAQGVEFSVEGASYPIWGQSLITGDLNGDAQDDIIAVVSGNLSRFLG